jgi:hypothetical protein
MKEKNYQRWVGKKVRRKVDGKVGKVIQPTKMNTWWIVEWEDGSRSPTPQRQMEFVPDEETPHA